MTISDDRCRHILDGEASGSGGHRHGTGRPGKTEFPARWDDDAVIQYVLDVARHPDETPLLQPNKRWLAIGVRDDVTVAIVITSSGKIVTAYPLAGGRGVVQNPEV